MSLEEPTIIQTLEEKFKTLEKIIDIFNAQAAYLNDQKAYFQQQIDKVKKIEDKLEELEDNSSQDLKYLEHENKLQALINDVDKIKRDLTDLKKT